MTIPHGTADWLTYAADRVADRVVADRIKHQYQPPVSA